MILTTDQLEQVQLAGYYQTKPEAIARALGVDADALMEELERKKSPVREAYYTGRDLAETELKIAVFELAKRGSSEAQKMAKQFIDELKISEA